MKLPNISGLWGIGKNFVMTNRPEILFGAAVAATGVAVVSAAFGGYKARGIVDEAQAEAKEALTPRQIANLTWHCYLPAATLTVGAIGATTGLHIVHVKEKKAMAAAALAAIDQVKADFKQYEKENTVGVMSNEEKQKVLEERAKKTPILDENGNEASHFQDSDGFLEPMYLVRDARTGRDIWSNRNRIDEALAEVNNVLAGSGNVEVNYFYTKAGFGNLPDGNQYGWSGALIDLKWEETVRDDGRPVRQFVFRPSPEKGFDDAHR